MKLLDVSIITGDVSALREFYAIVLNTTFDLLHGGDKRTEIHLYGITLSLSDNGHPPTKKEERVVLQFEVDDVDKECKRLQEAGIAIAEPPTTYPWGWRAMGVEDPEGNHIDFVCKVKKGI